MTNNMDGMHYKLSEGKRSEIFLSDFYIPAPLGRNSQSTDNQTAVDPEPLLTPSLLGVVFLAYSIAFVLAVFGNVAAIAVFTLGRRSRSDVRIFFINIAVVDLIVGIVCLPVSMVSSTLGFLFPDFMCPIVMFLQLTSVTTTVYMNCAMSVDRFVAVRFPLRRHVLPKCYIPAVVTAVWLASAAMSSVQLAVSRVERDVNGQGEPKCMEVWEDMNFVKYYSIIVLTVTYAIPACVIVLMYSLVCRDLWRRSLPGQVNHERDNRQLKSKRKVVRVFITMASLFIASWLPLHLFFILLHFYPGTLEYLQTEQQAAAFYYPAHLLAMSNSFQNPIVYGFLNENFRSDLAELAVKLCPLMRHLPFVAKAAAANVLPQTSTCSDDTPPSQSLPAPQHRRFRHVIEGSLRKILSAKRNSRSRNGARAGGCGLSNFRQSPELGSTSPAHVMQSPLGEQQQHQHQRSRCNCCLSFAATGGVSRGSINPPSPDACEANALLLRASPDSKHAECRMPKTATTSRAHALPNHSSCAELIRGRADLDA